ncbi:MAG: Gfo/Idh/MocA family oxidoreductase, partial [Candidatus Binatia bacterium]
LAFHGERGSIVLEETRIVKWEIEGEPERPVSATPTVAASSVPTAIGTGEFALQYQAIVDSLRDRRPPPVSAQEARLALATVLAIYESSRTGRPVTM